MAERGDAYFNPVTRTRMVFVAVPKDNGGRELAIDWFVPAGEKLALAAHYHRGPPGAIIERFDVLAGTALCRIGMVARTAMAPGAFEIPANMVHVHPANVGADELHVRQSIRLPIADETVLRRIEQYFETPWLCRSADR